MLVSFLVTLRRNTLLPTSCPLIRNNPFEHYPTSNKPSKKITERGSIRNTYELGTCLQLASDIDYNRWSDSNQETCKQGGGDPNSPQHEFTRGMIGFDILLGLLIDSLKIAS